MFEFDFRSGGVGGLRLGELKVSHGGVRTPVFMPVGTKATVKALDVEDLEELGAGVILANTYHLFLQPGTRVIEEMGGLHKFCGWSGPMLTDSGGFQVSSLSKVDIEEEGNGRRKMARITEEGVEFSSYIDGSVYFMSPEKAMQIQRALGADIVMAFDECTANRGKGYVRGAMERTHRWLVRSKAEWERLEKMKGKGEAGQFLFGIAQGGNYKDLRRESAKFVVEQNLPGNAIGGDSVGADIPKTLETISWVRDLFPENKPFYAMGVGTNPQDLFDVFYAGVDMVDCVAPTRLARSGYLYSGEFRKSGGRWGFESEYPKGRANIGKAVWRRHRKPICESCDCHTCARHSAAYLHHLFKANELLYYRLASVHNLRMMVRVGEILRGDSLSL